MKQGNLKAAIRDRKGNPAIDWALPDGRAVRVMVMKTPLLEMLDGAFEHKNTETGLTLTDDGLLTSEAPATVTLGPATVSVATADGEPVGKPFASSGTTLTVVSDISRDSVANFLDLGASTPKPIFTLDLLGDTPAPARAPFTLDL